MTSRGGGAAGARFEAMIGDAKLAHAAADRMAGARVAVGATDETGPAIEAHTRDLLDALSRLFAEQAYALGGRMSPGRRSAAPDGLHTRGQGDRPADSMRRRAARALVVRPRAEAP